LKPRSETTSLSAVILVTVAGSGLQPNQQKERTQMITKQVHHPTSFAIVLHDAGDWLLLDERELTRLVEALLRGDEQGERL
jgi:hypothetical protein